VSLTRSSQRNGALSHGGAVSIVRDIRGCVKDLCKSTRAWLLGLYKMPSIDTKGIEILTLAGFHYNPKI
jgi:hypothetical protein